MKLHFLKKHPLVDFYPIVHIDEAIYVILFSGLCSLAMVNKWNQLYKFPVYNTMPEKNIQIFRQSMEYLYGEHYDIGQALPSEKTELAFSEDKISLKCNLSFMFASVDTPINNDSTTTKKKSGRPPKSSSSSSQITTVKRSVGRPPKYQPNDPFPK